MKQGQKKALRRIIICLLVGPLTYYYFMNSGWGIHHPLALLLILTIWGSAIIGGFSVLYFLLSPFIKINKNGNNT